MAVVRRRVQQPHPRLAVWRVDVERAALLQPHPGRQVVQQRHQPRHARAAHARLRRCAERRVSVRLLHAALERRLLRLALGPQPRRVVLGLRWSPREPHAHPRCVLAELASQAAAVGPPAAAHGHEGAALQAQPRAPRRLCLGANLHRLREPHDGTLRLLGHAPHGGLRGRHGVGDAVQHAGGGEEVVLPPQRPHACRAHVVGLAVLGLQLQQPVHGALRGIHLLLHVHGVAGGDGTGTGTDIGTGTGSAFTVAVCFRAVGTGAQEHAALPHVPHATDEALQAWLKATHRRLGDGVHGCLRSLRALRRPSECRLHALVLEAVDGLSRLRHARRAVVHRLGGGLDFERHGWRGGGLVVAQLHEAPHDSVHAALQPVQLRLVALQSLQSSLGDALALLHGAVVGRGGLA